MDNSLERKCHLLSLRLWLNATDYANATGFPNTLGFLFYIWTGLYFCISDIVRKHNAESEMQRQFLKTACIYFKISMDESSQLLPLAYKQEDILDDFREHSFDPLTKDGIILIQDRILFWASMESGSELYVPSIEQELEFVMSVTAAIQQTAQIFSYSSDPISQNHTSTNVPTKQVPISTQSDTDTRIYFVHSFDGRSLRIPGSSIDEFHRRDKENEANYFQKYGHLRNRLFDYLRGCSKSYLRSSASVHNRESFMYLSTSILCSSPSLSEHYATVLKVYEDIITETLQLPTDTFCIYRSEKTLSDAQCNWIHTLKSTYHLDFHGNYHTNIFSDEKQLKKYAKDIFQMSAPRSHYGLKSQKALIALLRDFDSFSRRTINEF